MNGRTKTAVLGGAVAAIALSASAALAYTPGHQSYVVITGHGWTSAGLQGPTPAPNTCHLHHLAGSKDVLPDSHCEPGSIDRAVTQANLGSTICRSGGYTGSVRPSSTMTTSFKKKVFAAYGIPWSQASNYELDHLVPLEVGGSSDTRNLWPEPAADQRQYTRSAFVHNDKDALETKLHSAVCGHHISLAKAQDEFAMNWTTARP